MSFVISDIVWFLHRKFGSNLPHSLPLIIRKKKRKKSYDHV